MGWSGFDTQKSLIFGLQPCVARVEIAACGKDSSKVTVLREETPAASSTAPRRSHVGLGSAARFDRGVRRIFGVSMWAGMLLVAYWWMADRGVQDLASWASGLTSVGRIAGLLAAQLLLVQVLLMSRLPPLERAYGRVRLVQLHRLRGLWSFWLMITHIVTIIAGYASASWALVRSTLWQLLAGYGGVLLAAAGAACLIMVVVTSIKIARRRLRYESWHLLHLYGYLGVGLALPHQLWTGQEFLSRPAADAYWWGLWVAAAGAVISWRIVVPLARAIWHGLRVVSVSWEAFDVVSVTMTGRRLDRLHARAGEFINVRFLTAPVRFTGSYGRPSKDRNRRVTQPRMMHVSRRH
jgi:predicted ferric reductase